MDKRVQDDFVAKSNEASREAKRAGASHKELAVLLVKMASREYNDSPELQDEYETFALFAQEVHFEKEEEMKNVQDVLSRLEDY